MAAKKNDSARLAPLIVAILGALALWLFNIVTHIPDYLRPILVKIEHPLSYEFTAYDTLLHQVVRDDLVDYAAVKKSPLLNQAVDELARISPDYFEDNDSKLAFWINAYNLCALKTLADQYPEEFLKSRGHVIGIDLSMHTVGGKTYRLEQMKSLELVPRMKGPHPFAIFLTCSGMRGDPPLLDHAVTKAGLQKDSYRSFFKFIKDPTKVRYVRLTEILYLSPYLKINDAVWRGDQSPAGIVAQNMKDVGSVMFTRYNLPFNTYLNDLGLTILPKNAPAKGQDLNKQPEANKPSDKSTSATVNGQAEKQGAAPSNSATNAASDTGGKPQPDQTAASNGQTPAPPPASQTPKTLQQQQTSDQWAEPSAKKPANADAPTTVKKEDAVAPKK